MCQLAKLNSALIINEPRETQTGSACMRAVPFRARQGGSNTVPFLSDSVLTAMSCRAGGSGGVRVCGGGGCLDLKWEKHPTVRRVKIGGGCKRESRKYSV